MSKVSSDMSSSKESRPSLAIFLFHAALESLRWRRSSSAQITARTLPELTRTMRAVPAGRMWEDDELSLAVLLLVILCDSSWFVGPIVGSGVILCDSSDEGAADVAILLL
eukprot:CAMPEP_0194316334 /NCGR_PEP_ID=MMETSP0171-20130528/13140_1 /TAXON_ID=218684 /ORGANISM="Corethron pennatum, Strain L29A3" /LENGTH=109 /DNA_ID=CAMNT_0039072533 /DNA_START=236 /DNA_END=565 /DNA_ORIENTATION=+